MFTTKSLKIHFISSFLQLYAATTLDKKYIASLQDVLEKSDEHTNTLFHGTIDYLMGNLSEQAIEVYCDIIVMRSLGIIHKDMMSSKSIDDLLFKKFRTHLMDNRFPSLTPGSQSQFLPAIVHLELFDHLDFINIPSSLMLAKYQHVSRLISLLSQIFLHMLASFNNKHHPILSSDFIEITLLNQLIYNRTPNNSQPNFLPSDAETKMLFHNLVKTSFLRSQNFIKSASFELKKMEICSINSAFAQELIQTLPKKTKIETVYQDVGLSVPLKVTTIVQPPPENLQQYFQFFQPIKPYLNEQLYTSQQIICITETGENQAELLRFLQTKISNNPLLLKWFNPQPRQAPAATPGNLPSNNFTT